jgi:signal transduction histidine kinase
MPARSGPVQPTKLHPSTGTCWTIQVGREAGARFRGSYSGCTFLITQVLLNLTINAIQAMPKGGEILLSTHPGDRHLAIQVRDEGSGVSDQDRERIFDPFYTTKESGTGLGLAISHQIVQQHGGNLTARRNPGRGMTFTVQLPWDHRRTR